MLEQMEGKRVAAVSRLYFSIKAAPDQHIQGPYRFASWEHVVYWSSHRADGCRCRVHNGK